ncbi:hypothetical protein N7537_006978 [Penicillium hordei]|uniref:NACHT-NTPase and P-loop NTPases N-terminal domain-containing protein n=1 Tax=Penicillium hordei TaxID=40994 RepID=A0AAD6E8G5_9EURO|nr:uncharacterized protein N7537_006978 [Penicillium hordei]KAJ5604022.1 hypothetical protein N7537_006978 [Penicillium hordei]
MASTTFGQSNFGLQVADTTTKTAKGILALKRMWNDVHEVPEYINSLLDRLTLVQSVLDDLETELSRDQQLFASNSAIKLSIRYCKNAKDKLDALVSDLGQRDTDKERSTRNRARVKVIFEKGVARRLEAELRDAMQLLGIAQQTYAIALARQQPALIAGQRASTAGLNIQGQSSHSTNLIPSIGMSSTSSKENKTEGWIAPNKEYPILPWTYSVFGSYSSKFSVVDSTATIPGEEVYRARIQLPAWLTRYVWDICARRASNGWTYNLRHWTVRPFDADVFDAASDGDLLAMIPLFNERKASLYDRDPRGWTLLHYAAFEGDLSTITYLVRSGLSMHETSADGYTPLYYLCRNNDEASDIASVYRFIKSNDDLSDAACALFLPRAEYYRKSTLHRFLWSVPSLWDLVKAESPLITLDSRFTSIIWEYVDAKILLDIFVREVSDAETVRRQLNGATVSSLHEFSKVYFHNVCRRSNAQHMRTKSSEWRRLARWLFKGLRARDLSRQGNEIWEATTPLFAGLMDARWPVPAERREVRQNKRQLESALVFWLEDLQAAGVNLGSYGWWERKMFDEGWALRNASWTVLACDGKGPRLKSIYGGPLPQDWKILWDWHEEVAWLSEPVVSVFFQWAESPPPVMPGSWQDDEEF